ncbi:hypothetical protein C0J52_22803 [Blattella germanica]|nr:hypothetical protein C0J52_22803 [Blattella germanica]
MQEMEELTLNEIECPVCLEYMVRPIVLCISGHNFCGNCRKQMSDCPICKKHFFTRNIALEEVASKIYVLTSNMLNNESQQSVFDTLDLFRLRVSIFSEIGHIILNELKCDTCGNYSVPPIYFCINGHSTCHTCQKCTKCDLIKTQGRNYALEKIAKVMECPCPYNKQGCSLILTLNQLKHIKICEYRQLTCPLSDVEVTKCPWFGTRHELKSHLTERHVFCDVHEESELWMQFKYSTNSVIFTKRLILVASVAIKNGGVYYRINFAGPKTDILQRVTCYHEFFMNNEVFAKVKMTPSTQWLEVSRSIFNNRPSSKVTLLLKICKK